MLPRQHLYQWGAGALDKDKRGGGAHRALITFLLLYFVCYVEYPKADFSRATLPALYWPDL